MGVLMCCVWQRSADETRAGAGENEKKNKITMRDPAEWS